jgi:hypothetical protein
MIKIGLIYFLLLFSQISFGQIHPDPYKMNTRYAKLRGDNSKEIILKSKVWKMRRMDMALNKKKSANSVPNTFWCFIFNKNGLPMRVVSVDEKPIIVMKNPQVTKYEYAFKYDNSNRVKELTEISQERFFPHIDKKIYSFAYDSIGRLKNEKEIDSTIYFPGFKYRGTTYNDYARVTLYSFYYGKNYFIDSIGWSQFESTDNSTRKGIMHKHCSFDTAFMFLEGSKEKLDSNGEIAEWVQYKFRGHWYTKDTEAVVHFTYVYDDQHHVIQRNCREGNSTWSTKWENNDKGLILKEQNSNSLTDSYTKYEYEYFDSK